MTAISANELKTRGVAAIESALENEPEAAISVRGKVRYVVCRSSSSTICGNASSNRP